MKRFYALSLTVLTLTTVGLAQNTDHADYGFQGTVVQQDGITIETVKNFGVVGVEDAVFAAQYYGARSDVPTSVNLTTHNNYIVWQVAYPDINYFVDINNPTLVVNSAQLSNTATTLTTTVAAVPTATTEAGAAGTAIFANGETVLVGVDSPVVYADTSHASSFICTVPYQAGITFENIGSYGRVQPRDAVYASLTHAQRTDLPQTAALAVYNNFFVWQISFVDTYVLVDVDNADSHLILPISPETTASIASVPGPIYIITAAPIPTPTVVVPVTPVVAEPVVVAPVVAAPVVTEPVVAAPVVTEVVENNVTNEVYVDVNLGFEIELFFDGSDGGSSSTTTTDTTYDSEGYDANGFDNEGYNRAGYNASGYDREGYDAEGYNAEGYDRNGYYKFTNVDSGNTGTVVDSKYDAEGYDINGFDAEGYNREGYSASGFDRDGYDAEGYNAEGYDRDGYYKFTVVDNNTAPSTDNTSIYDAEGYDANGFDSEGYNREGYNAHGYDRDGYDAEGYNSEGYDRDGYYKYTSSNTGDSSSMSENMSGVVIYDAEGYDSEGYDSEGYDREGYDRNGYDREGYDREGYNSEGYDRDGYYKYSGDDNKGGN